MAGFGNAFFRYPFATGLCVNARAADEDKNRIFEALPKISCAFQIEPSIRFGVAALVLAQWITTSKLPGAFLPKVASLRSTACISQETPGAAPLRSTLSLSIQRR